LFWDIRPKAIINPSGRENRRVRVKICKEASAPLKRRQQVKGVGPFKISEHDEFSLQTRGTDRSKRLPEKGGAAIKRIRLA